MPQNKKSSLLPTTNSIPKYPNWLTLAEPNIQFIYADHRVETDIDANGVGRVRVKPGYNANVEEIRYGY